jgi:hypothetical protein
MPRRHTSILGNARALSLGAPAALSRNLTLYRRQQVSRYNGFAGAIGITKLIR